MNWTEMRIHTTHEAVEPISNILHESGANGVVIEDPVDLNKERESFFGEIYALNRTDYPDEGVYIKAYLPSNDNLSVLVEDIKKSIQKLKFYNIDLGKNEITLNELNEEDWATAWKQYYKPITVSDTMTIVPSWEHVNRKTENETIIELDPGMAFGTGSHSTTLLSLQAIENYIKENDIVIDVGSGSGILSIAASLLGAEKVYAFDLDDVAVKSTQINSELNGQEQKIIAKQGDLLNRSDIQANLIVSNILAEIIVTFIADAWKSLKSDGLFITSGIIEAKQGLVEDALKQNGFQIIEINKMEDWLVIVARKS